MKIIQKEFGRVMTNCYIVYVDGGEVVIDPGEGSYEWVMKNSSNVLAVFNTHGHYDHAFDDYLFSRDGVKIYIDKNDAFWLSDDPFGLIGTPCKPDVLVDDGDLFEFGGKSFCFHRFAGHTPGCCAITVDELMFSGDFIFKDSIGRWDFPYSNAASLKESLSRILKWQKNYIIYPGHGEKTTLDDERENLRRYYKHFVR